jgi:hypothetical protein
MESGGGVQTQSAIRILCQQVLSRKGATKADLDVDLFV